MRKHLYYSKSEQDIQIDYWYPVEMKATVLVRFCEQLGRFGFQSGALAKRIKGTPGYSFKSGKIFTADFIAHSDGPGNKFLIINVRVYEYGSINPSLQLRTQLYKIAEHLEKEFRILENKFTQFYIYYEFFQGLEATKSTN